MIDITHFSTHIQVHIFVIECISFQLNQNFVLKPLMHICKNIFTASDPCYSRGQVAAPKPNLTLTLFHVPACHCITRLDDYSLAYQYSWYTQLINFTTQYTSANRQYKQHFAYIYIYGTVLVQVLSCQLLMCSQLLYR